MKKKIVSIVLILTILLSLFAVVPITVKAETSGKCGDNVCWNLSDNGVLTINGSGNMYDYSAYGTRAPWYSERTSITRVIIEYGINNIGGCAFIHLENLTNISIPSSVNSIDKGAFIGCKNLESITIPESVISLGKEAFASTGLSYVRIPDSVIEMGDDIFKNCDRLTEVYLPNCITTIPRFAFHGCNSLINIVIPESVNRIEDYAFSMSSLTSINIPKNVDYIGSEAFANTKISTIVIPDNVTQLKSQAFFCCGKLKSAVIGNGVTTISYGTFQGCSNLEKLSVGIGVKTINYNAFEYIYNLNVVYYAGSADDWSQIDIDYYLMGNNCLKDVTKHYNCWWITDSQLTVLGERFSHNLSYYANIWDSTQYNPELAHLMMTFANAAYDPVKVGQGYLDLGLSQFEPYNYFNYYSVYGTEKVCYSIASTVDNDGTICLLVTLRGSGSITDISQGTLDWLGNLDVDSAFQIGYQPHKNFNSAAAHVYKGIDTYLSAKYNTSISEGSNIKYFVTGHSRGAAVANLVEYMLEPEVGKQNLYGYNFAVPDTAKISDQTNVKGFDNIFNISNLQDPVSYVPGHIVDVLTSVKQWLASGRVENKWRKWGESVWFSDENGAIDAAAHSPTRYLDYMRSRKSISTYTETPKFHDEWKTSGWGPFMKVEYKLYATYCPVDVEMVDENGKVVASIIGGVVDYHDSHFGEVIVTTVDDHKMFAVPSDKNYILKMVGNDVGTLDYYVAKTDILGDDTSIIKSFENVALDKDKEMLGALVNVRNEDDNTIQQEEKLLLLENDTEAGVEILPNGEEKECVSRFVLGDVNNNGDIDITDATFVQRKLTKIDTPYTDEILQQGDVDGNGTLELMDVTAIQYYLNQMSIPYLIGVNVYTQ